MEYYKNKNHSIITEFRRVHEKMSNQYKLKQEAKTDIVKAQRMEYYLRMFKKLGNNIENNGTTSIQHELEVQAMQQIAQDVGKALGIRDYALFRNQHFWYVKRQKEWSVDDVFEAELTSLLNIALQKAAKNPISVQQSGAKAIGNLPGNIADTFIDTLKQEGTSLFTSSSLPSQLINIPTAKSGKVDIEGYSADFDITASIKPEWSEFVSLFQGAKCTVKNYSSAAKTETIHLGKSNLMKAIVGQLDELGYEPPEATHIYFHALNSYNKFKTNTQSIGGHILHLRFAYELAGGGLYLDGKKLDAANFFIYNDPSSDRIWVRSTKEMIANALEYLDPGISNPFTSGVVILKQSFN